jgi:phage tail sheath gpL-like
MALDTGTPAFKSGFLRYCIQNVGNAAPDPCKPLFIGQRKAATGTATDNVVYSTYSYKSAVELFGPESYLADAARIHFSCCPNIPLYMISVPANGSGVNAIHTLTFTGTASAGGTINFRLAQSDFAVTVVSGDTPTIIAAAAAVAINADLTFPYTAVAALGVVTLTADIKGTEGTYLTLITNPYFGQVLPAGVSVAHANPTPGTGDPNITAAIAAIGACCYDCIALLFTDDAEIQKLVTYLDDVTGTWACNKQQCFGHLYHAKVGTVGTLVTYGNAYNDPERTIIPVLPNYSIPPRRFAAAWASVNCCSVCVDPTVPVRYDGGYLCTLTDSSLCSSLFTQDEKEALATAGIAVWDISSTRGTYGSSLWIENNITNFKYNDLGQLDRLWVQVETRYTVAQFIKNLTIFWFQTFTKAALVNNSTPIPAGKKAFSPNTINAIIKNYLRENLGTIIDDDNQLEGVVQVERNTDGRAQGVGDPDRVDIIISPDLVNLLLRAAITVRPVVQRSSVF